jgi:hypothetical protein
MARSPYERPEVETIPAAEILEALGPAAAGGGSGSRGSGNRNPYGDGVDPNNPLG